MNKLSKRHLWDWFSRHQHEYLTLYKRPKKEANYWLNELTTHLRAYFKFLGYTIEWDAKKHTGVLNVTVNGKSTHFKKVHDLVSRAPVIPAWTIQALEPARPIDFWLEEEIDFIGIDPRELFFAFCRKRRSKGVVYIYHPFCTDDNAHAILDIARKAMYNILGEETYGTAIRGLGIFNLSEADPDDIQPLEELVAAIGERNSVSMIVNSEGKLICQNDRD
jgi:hypothetical protein